MYLLDTKSAGGANHQTPLDRTPLICNEEADFQSAGIWGSMASWEQADGTRWVLTPFWGAVHPTFKTPASAIIALGAWSAVLACAGKFAELASGAIFIGWIFYGLGAAGQAGVARAIEIIRNELDVTMALMGVNKVDDIDRKVIMEM